METRIMQPTTELAVVTKSASPAQAEAGETKTAVAMGRRWSILPESSDTTTGDALIYIFTWAVGILSLITWVAGAVVVHHYRNSDDNTGELVGKILLGTGLAVFCCGGVYLGAKKAYKEMK